MRTDGAHRLKEVLIRGQDAMAAMLATHGGGTPPPEPSVEMLTLHNVLT